MVPFLLYAKDLKKLLDLLLISPRWVNCSGDYTLTIDGLRGAVLQMIAHGFVDCFSSLTSFDMKHELSLKWVVYTQSPFASMFLLLVLFSALPTFNFVGVYGLIQPIKLMYGLPFRRNDYHLGRLLHVENVPASNARKQYV
jgi:NADH-quinone oxidoreductase subunit M